MILLSVILLENPNPRVCHQTLTTGVLFKSVSRRATLLNPFTFSKTIPSGNQWLTNQSVVEELVVCYSCPASLKSILHVISRVIVLTSLTWGLHPSCLCRHCGYRRTVSAFLPQTLNRNSQGVEILIDFVPSKFTTPLRSVPCCIYG